MLLPFKMDGNFSLWPCACCYINILTCSYKRSFSFYTKSRAYYNILCVNLFVRCALPKITNICTSINLLWFKLFINHKASSRSHCESAIWMKLIRCVFAISLIIYWYLIESKLVTILFLIYHRAQANFVQLMKQYHLGILFA